MHKNIHQWMGGYLRHSAHQLMSHAPAQRHLIFAVCDHYEPLWAKPTPAIALARVRAWRDHYKTAFSSFRDVHGHAPKHSFFFPGEEYKEEYLDDIAHICSEKLGEVELHLHHDNDTASNLKDSIQSYLKLFANHGFISRDKTGAFQYAFIHGNWALANGRPDGHLCGVDNEMDVLFRSGCYADFTFPSAPDICQPGVVNQIYWPKGPLHEKRPYDKSEKAKVGCFYDDRLLMMTGPLALSQRKLGLRIESSTIDATDPPSKKRVDAWVNCNIHIKNRPEWVFVKVHTHGAPEKNAATYLGQHGIDMHRYLSSRYNDGETWKLHYVSAREMYNIASAAMFGEKGDPSEFRNFFSHTTSTDSKIASMDRYGRIVNTILHPAWERYVKKRPILDYQNELLDSQYFDLRAIENLQQQRLRQLLTHTNQSCSYYQEQWHDKGIPIDDQFKLENLKSLPILTRQDAKESIHSRLASTGPPVRVTKTTGGTTGEPLKIQYDMQSEYRRQAMRGRGFGWAGYLVGMPVLHYWGSPTMPVETLKSKVKKKIDHLIKRETWIDCTDQSEEAQSHAVRIIATLQPKVIFCYAQALVELARYINANQLRNWPDINIICGAEKIYPHDTTILNRAFGPNVFETYGCREFMLIASECEEHQGMHVSMEHLIVEIVNDQGAPVADGEIGNVVVTDLFNYASPLIRYQNGDVGKMASNQSPCACGRPLKKLADIEGRKTETLVDHNGNRVSGMIFNLIFSPLAEKVIQFQVTQHRDHSITINVVCKEPLTDDAKAHIIHHAVKHLPNIDISINKIDSIPLTKSGKRQLVISELKV